MNTKIKVPPIKMNVLLCILSIIYIYLGLLIVPLITLIGQIYYIYASRIWKRRYEGKRNFDLAHSLFHIGHPKWLTDYCFMLFIAGIFITPGIMFIQSLWLNAQDDKIKEITLWGADAVVLVYYCLFI